MESWVDKELRKKSGKSKRKKKRNKIEKEISNLGIFKEMKRVNSKRSK